MITRNVLLRVMFCVSLLLFIYAICSPWVGKPRSSIIPSHFSGEELYWSFQVVFYPDTLDGEEYRLFSWDFWFGPHDRLLLWDFWFVGEMQYHGLSFGWIRLFFLQLFTVFSGIYVLVWRWQELKYFLIPLLFSILSVLTGLELVSIFMFVWEGYANVYWGLPFAIFSTLTFFGIFLVRYLIGRRGRRVTNFTTRMPKAAVSSKTGRLLIG